MSSSPKIGVANGFSEKTAEEVKAALAAADAAGAKALILDLRDNPGGLLGQAVEMTDLFLPEAVVVNVTESPRLFVILASAVAVVVALTVKLAELVMESPH